MKADDQTSTDGDKELKVGGTIPTRGGGASAGAAAPSSNTPFVVTTGDLQIKVSVDNSNNARGRGD